MDDSASVAAAFERLGNEVRVAILRALVDHRRAAPEDRGLGFATLQDRVGVADSGNFDYHLDKLRGRFVVDDGEGYRLTTAGEMMAAAILAGRHRSAESLGPKPTGHPCGAPGCEADLLASYEDGILTVACGADHLAFRTGVPPAAATDRDLESVLALATERARTHVRAIRRGACAKCYGEADVAVESPDGGDDAVVYAATCGRCGTRYTAPPVLFAASEASVVAFCWDHGVDLGATPPWRLSAVGTGVDAALLATDPPAVEVTIGMDDGSITVTLDGAARTLAVERPSG